MAPFISFNDIEKKSGVEISTRFIPFAVAHESRENSMRCDLMLDMEMETDTPRSEMRSKLIWRTHAKKKPLDTNDISDA